MTPLNIVSFQGNGNLPLCREAIPNDKFLPCDSFLEGKPVETVKAMKAGREAV